MDNSRWHAPGVMCLVIAIFAAAVYLPSLYSDFAYDDFPIIVRNPAVNGSSPWYHSILKPWWPPQKSIDPLYRPVTSFSFWLQMKINPSPGCFIGVNILLHALISSLVGLLALKTFSSDRAGWFAGLIFALHPLHCEPVCLVVGRAELFSGIFSILIILYRLRYPPGKKASLFSSCTISGLLLLAVFSKESSLIVLPILLAMDWNECKAGKREYINTCLKSYWFAILLVLAFFFLTRWLHFGYRTSLPRDFINPYANPLAHAELATQVLTPFKILFISLYQWFYPQDLSPLWGPGSFILPSTFWDSFVLAGFVVIIVLAILFAWGWKKNKTLALLIYSLSISLVLPCHFLPSANWLYAERWMYLPSILLSLLTTYFFIRIGRVPGILFLGFFLAFCSRVTWDYQHAWDSNLTFMQVTVSRQPDNYHGLVGLVATMNSEGELSETEYLIQKLKQEYPESCRTWFWVVLYESKYGTRKGVEQAVKEYSKLLGPSQLPLIIRQIRQELKLEGNLPDDG